MCCKKTGSCLLCKAIADAHEVQTFKTEKKHTQGMEDWLTQMKDEKRWTEATDELKMLRVCYHLSQSQMKAERKYISGFGAVRMTRAESIEMIVNKA
eukprot:10202173-Heterocapsa_arctica.AAC.1